MITYESLNLAFCLAHIVKPTVLGKFQSSEPVKCILAKKSRNKITTFMYPVIHHSIKTYRTEEVKLHPLSLALVGGE
jgi:hypothetical protein